MAVANLRKKLSWPEVTHLARSLGQLNGPTDFRRQCLYTESSEVPGGQTKQRCVAR